jgi:serine/threonine protein kinase
VGSPLTVNRGVKMRDLIRQVVEGYRSLKLEKQADGYVLFSATEPDTRQPVWIKILPGVLGQDPQLASRFRSLAQSLRQLNHPNIVAVRQVAEKHGLPYVVSRAVEKGRSLADQLDQSWAVDSAADLAMQAGQALEHAANKGVAHGALSPETILVQDNGRVLVTDFGLAALLGLVGRGVGRAAVAYQAPERLAGQPADAASDVYSLAAILYRLLADRPPQVVQGKVLPPSRFKPDVPPALDAAVVRALDPDPAQRYGDVHSFVAALGAVKLAPEAQKPGEPPPVHCPQCGTINQNARFCRKCGTRLKQPEASVPRPPAESKLDEPIQITTIEVGHVEMGSGVEIHETAISDPTSVAGTEIAALFPQPLEMPRLDLAVLGLAAEDQEVLSMPEPLPMPTFEWAEVAPPMPAVPSIGDVYGDRGEEES